MFVVCSLLCVYCLWPDVSACCCLMFVVRCWLYVAWCFLLCCVLFVACCLLSWFRFVCVFRFGVCVVFWYCICLVSFMVLVVFFICVFVCVCAVYVFVLLCCYCSRFCSGLWSVLFAFC